MFARGLPLSRIFRGQGEKFLTEACLGLAGSGERAAQGCGLGRVVVALKDVAGSCLRASPGIWSVEQLSAAGAVVVDAAAAAVVLHAAAVAVHVAVMSCDVAH